LAIRRARRQARADRRLRALVGRLHGCLADLPSTSGHVLALRAGVSGRPGLSPTATARVLGISAGREARLERTALNSLRAAGRAGCGVAGTPTVLQVAATTALVASPSAFAAAGHAESARSTGVPAAPRAHAGGVTRGSVHRPAAGATHPVQRAAAAGTPAWAVLVALGLLALAGAIALVRQAAASRRAAVSHVSDTPALAPLAVVAPAPPRAAPSAEVEPSTGASSSSASSPWLPPTGPAPDHPAPGTALEPSRSTALASRSARRPHHTRLVAVIVTALASGIVRLVSRRRSGRH
jgi:hypothetical protein